MILAFGGFDPTGGAGVLMDARAIHAAGGYAAAVPSCLAVQTTSAVDRIVPLPREALDRSLAAAAASFRIAAVKIGMVGTRSAAEALLSFLGGGRRGAPVVLDPVLRSSGGVPLIAPSAWAAWRRLLPRATVLTPNLPEAERILGRTVASFPDAVIAARDLALATGASVLLKGGHFPWPGRRGVDILFERGRVTLLSPSPGRPRRGRDPHGTGCALSAALAARLALGDPLVEAARRAKALLEAMVASGFPSAEGRWTLGRPDAAGGPSRTVRRAGDPPP